MKKILLGLFILLTISFVGCKTNENYHQSCGASTYSSKSFNQETYIWESWFFNTNSTSRTNK